MLELTEKKQECERIRKQVLCKEKKTASSFEGFSDILCFDSGQNACSS